MASNSRKLRNVLVPADGGHVGWLFQNSKQFQYTLGELLNWCKSNNQKIIFLSQRSDPERPLSRFVEHNTLAKQLLSSGQFLIFPALDALNIHRTYTLSRMVDFFRYQTAQSQHEGYSGLCVIADMRWVTELAEFSDTEAAQRDFICKIAEIEEKLSEYMLGQDCLLVSYYDRRFFNAAALLEFLSAYPRLIVGDQLYENLYYQPPHPSGTHHRQQNILIHFLRSLDETKRTQALHADSSTNLAADVDSVQLLRAVIDSMGDGLIVTDETGRMLLFNKSAEWILGYGIINRRLEERIHIFGNYLPDMKTPYPMEDLPISRALRGEETDQAEIFVRNEKRPEGVWVSVNARPIRDSRGLVRGAVLVLRNISEQKAAAQENEALKTKMFQTQKMESLGVLAGGVAHDFNNLLMGVLGNVNLARKDLPEENPAVFRLDQIAVAARRLADLTNQLLAYAGHGNLIEEKINLSELMLEMQELLRPAISKKTKISCDFAQRLYDIQADATQIRQVIMNLITNASDAHGKNPGTINVATGFEVLSEDDLQHLYFASDPKRSGRYVYLEVRDQGNGIPSDKLQKIFDPFYSTKVRGRGLGLAAVLGIIRRHGGALEVISELNVGTTFRVFFPACKTASEIKSKPEQQAQAWKGSGKILVIDDEDVVRDVAKDMLEEYGFEVLVAANGLEGLQQYDRHAESIQAVLLDMTMPDMNGDEVFRRLREKHNDAKVIFSSGYNELDIARQISEAQVASYLQKPYALDSLISTVRQAIER